MLRALVKKLDNMQEQMTNTSREMEIIRNNKKEMIAVKHTITEMKSTMLGSLVD